MKPGRGNPTSSKNGRVIHLSEIKIVEPENY
jgi:hypothetical protein